MAPILGYLPDVCCACATSGHAAALPSSAMKSRRFKRSIASALQLATPYQHTALTRIGQRLAAGRNFAFAYDRCGSEAAARQRLIVSRRWWKLELAIISCREVMCSGGVVKRLLGSSNVRARPSVDFA